MKTGPVLRDWLQTEYTLNMSKFRDDSRAYQSLINDLKYEANLQNVISATEVWLKGNEFI